MTPTATELERAKERLLTDDGFYSETCLKIVDQREKLVALAPKPGQRRLLEVKAAQEAAGQPVRIIVLKARREGISTQVQGLMIKRVTQRRNHKALVLAHDKGTASEIFSIGETMYANLPDEEIAGLRLKPPVSGSRRGQELLLGEPSRQRRLEGHVGHNSSYRVDTANEYEAGRGFTYHSLHLSELGFYAAAEKKLTAILSTVPKEPGTMAVIESTANGYNLFRRLWVAAVSGNSDFAPLFLPWYEEPDYVYPFANDEEREAFIATVGHGEYGEDEPALVELGVTPEQLHWRRWAIANRCHGDIRAFMQEFPACLTAENRVSTERGIIPIAEALECRETESGHIQAAGPQPEADIYRLTTKGGRVLRGTFDHPVHTPGGEFVWLGKLEPGQKITLRPPRFAERRYTHRWNPVAGVEHRVVVTKDWARFLGYFMGDGSWHDGQLSFACDAKDPDVVEDCAAAIEAVTGRAPRRRVIERVKGRKGCVELRQGCRPLQDALIALGVIGHSPAGNNWRREICVPEAIWRSPRPVVREFLRALFEADGSASGGRVRWATSKEGFAREVQLLLLGFGIPARITREARTAGGRQVYTTHVIALRCLASERFHAEIGFIGKRKRASAAAPSNGIGRPPAPIEFVDEVVSVEPDGREVTYDLTVEDTHVFSANGILTHNTWEEAFLSTGRQVFAPSLVAKVMARAQRSDVGAQRGVLEAQEWEKGRYMGREIEIPRKPLWVPERDAKVGIATPMWRRWEEPDRGDETADPPRPPGQYVVTVDSSSGRDTANEGTDYFAIQVINHRTLAQVAEFHARGIDADLVAREAMLIAQLYAPEWLPWLAVEITGGYGVSIAEKLWRVYRYPMLYFRRPAEQKGERPEDRLGWSMDVKTKPLVVDHAKELLRTGNDGIRSKGLAGEMQTFVKDDKGRMGAEEDYFDDRLDAWMVAQYVAHEKPLRHRRDPSSRPRRGRAPSLGARPRSYAAPR